MHQIEKFCGETPFQALVRFRAEREIPDAIPLSYAGRLDPMASGILLVLEGPECADRSRYLGLDKTYELEILLGVSSDTGDVLGLVEEVPARPIGLAEATTAAAGFAGRYPAPYPAFSSRTVQGRPLFAWAREGRLGEISAPIQNGSIHEIAVTGLRAITCAELRGEVTVKLDSLHEDAGDFRISAVRASWERLLVASDARSWQICTLEAKTSAGVYMRTLADDIGRALGMRGLAFAIRRTRIALPD